MTASASRRARLRRDGATFGGGGCATIAAPKEPNFAVITAGAQAARPALVVLASDAVSFVHGAHVDVNGGLLMD